MNRTIRKRIQMQRKREIVEGFKRAEVIHRIEYQQYLERTKISEILNRRLREEGKLGVANSIDVLMANINEMVENTDKYFLKLNLNDVLEDPSLAGSYYNMAYLPGTFVYPPYDKKPNPVKDFVETTVRGSGSIEQMELRAQRNLAYKILRKKATHGVNYQVERNDDFVILRAIPVILTREM